MKTAIIKISEITGHPSNRMDAEYWIGKKSGKKAHKEVKRGFLVEDDVNGKEMLTESDKDEYNKTMLDYQRAKRKINKLNKKLKK